MAIECAPKTKVDDVQAEVDYSKSIFDDYKTAKYHQVTDFIMGKVFRENSAQVGWTPASLVDRNNVKKLIAGIKSTFENALIEAADEEEGSDFGEMSDEAINDINDNILPNFDKFIGHYLTFNSVINNAQTVVEELTEDAGTQNDNSTGEGEAGSDGETPATSETEPQEKYKERPGNTESPITLASSNLKLAFRLIPKADWSEDLQKSVILKDADGLPTVADFGTVFNLLLNKLSGTKDYEEMIAKLSDPDTLRVVPEAQYIGEILKIDKENSQRTVGEYRLLNEFYQLFSKPKVQVQSAFLLDSGDMAVFDEISGNVSGIREQFRSTFQLGDVNDNVKKYLKKDDLYGYSLYLPKGEKMSDHLPNLPTSDAERLDFLSLLGIKFSGRQFLDSDAKREAFEDMLLRTTNFLHNSLVNRLSARQVIREPLDDLSTKFVSPEGVTIQSEKRSLGDLIEFESKYSKVIPSLSTRTANGELAYLVSLDNQLTAVTTYLNSAESLSELMKMPAFRTAKYNPLFKTSYTVQFLFNEDGTRRVDPDGKTRTIGLDNLSGFKKSVKNRTINKLERDLSTRDKFIQDLNMMWTEGKTDTLRPEVSHSFFTTSMKNYNGETFKYFRTNGFLSDFKSNGGFRQIIYNYLTAEIARIKSFAKKAEENPGLTDLYGKFSIFYQTLEQNNPALGEDLKAAGKFDVNSEIFERFMTEYQNQLDGEVHELLDEMNKLGISKDELVSQNAKKLINPDLRKDEMISDKELTALMRSFVASTLVQNVEFSILYGVDPLYTLDFHKRLKGVSSTGDLAAVHSLFDEYRQSSYENMFHDKYSVAGALGIDYRNNSKNFQTKTLIEYKQDNNTYAYMQGNIVQDIQNSLLRRDPNATKYTNEYIINELLAKREDQKPADGQGYIPLDAHRELSLRHGFNTEAMETVYRYEGLILRRDILDQKLSEEDERELQSLEQQIYSNPNKYAAPVLKFTYWGGIENTTIDTRALDKMSAAPLLPSDVRNHPKLKKLLLDMTKNQLGYVKYKSGTKIFTRTPVDINNIGDVDLDSDLYSTELLKIQIKPKSQQNDGTSIPTQLLKLIFSNLFSEGKPVNEKVQSLYNGYIQALHNIQSLQQETLLDELGISSAGVDMTKLSDRLIRQAKMQQLNSNTIHALEVEKGSLKGVLEESGFVKQIIDLVSGLSDTRLRRWQMPGGDFVLVSNANRDHLGFYKYDENGTIAADIRITMNGEFVKLLNRTHPDGKPIGTIERINALLKNKKWREDNKKSLTVILGRVPIQGPNSMEFGLVKEFLSPTLGNVVILPDEATFKSGLDFDYDKQKVMTPSFTKNGEYIDNVASANQQLEQLERQRNGLITEPITPENLKETMGKIKSYITDVRDILESGQFTKLTPRTQSQPEVAEIKDTFTKVVNLEVARQSIEDILKTIDTYRDYETPVDSMPFVPDARFQMYLEDQLDNTINDIDETIDMFYTKLGKFIGKGYEFRDKVLTLFQMKNKELQENYNHIVEGYRDVLSLPEMFAELVTPNSIKTISPIADRNAALKGTSLNLPKNNQVFNYLQNLHVKNLLFAAKAMMAPHAVDNTFMEMIQYLGINLNKNYQKKWGTQIVPRTINHQILSPEEVSKIEKGGKILISQRDDLEGNVKQHYDSEGINFTIDSAKDPRFALLNITWNNVGVFNFLKLMGYPYSRITDFLNQPVLLKYIELRENGLSKNDAIVEIAKRLGIKKVRPTQELLSEKAYNINKKDPKYKFTKEEKRDDGRYAVEYMVESTPSVWDVMALLRSIDNRQPLHPDYQAIKDVLTYQPLHNQLESKINNPIAMDDFNLRVFASFVSMDEHNSSFRNFHYYFNNDKVKVSTPTNVKDKDRLRETLLLQQIIAPEDIVKMENDSPVSAFISNKTLRKVYSSILPIVGRSDVQDTMDRLYSGYSRDFNARNQRDLRNMPKVLTSDFITATLFNFNIENEENFLERNRHLLIREVDKKTIAGRLTSLRKQPFYPKLAKQFPVLDQLVISNFRVDDSHDLNGLPQYTVIRNIKLVKPISETSIEEESIIDQFRDLMTYKIKERKFTKEEKKLYTTALHGFMKDLFNVGILQSGVNKSRMGFSEYIPQEYIRSLFAPALRQLESSSPAEFANFLAKFQSQFRYNNPRYFPYLKKDDIYGNIANNNKYSARFKLYDQNLEYVVDDAEDVDEDNPSQEEPAIAQETPKAPTIPETKYTPITEITRDNKKEKFNVLQGDQTMKETEGYRVHIKEYPNFKGFVYKLDNQWSVNEENSGMAIGAYSSSVKGVLAAAITKLNKVTQNPVADVTEILTKIGITQIQPEGKPPIQPRCK